MIIVCPQCDTSFSLPDEMYKPGRKARCSQCSAVFPMSAPFADKQEKKRATEPSVDEMPPTAPAMDKLPQPGGERHQRKRSKRFLAVVVGVVIFCLVGVGVGGYMVYTAYSAYSKEKKAVAAAAAIEARRALREQEAKQRREQDHLVNSITLVDVKQTVVNNQKIGPLVVIQGYARNDFDTPREFIAVEGRLLDKDGKDIVTGKVFCGITLSLVQLEVLTADELKKALNNNLDVMANNTNIEPGRSVHFILVFAGVPENLYSYEVRPVSASLVQTDAVQ